MKKVEVKKHLESIVSGTLATSILVSSCNCYHSDNIYEKYMPSVDIGEHLLPISISIRPNDAKYIMALQQLCMAILDDPKMAKCVYDNPETILHRYGFKGKIRLDDSVVKIILALGDDDINNAIKEKNMEKFLYLCRQKKYISDVDKVDILSDKYYQEQLAKYEQYTATRSLDFVEQEFIWVAGAIAVAVVAVVVLVGFGAGWNVGAAYNSFVKVNRVSTEESELRELSVIDIVPMKVEDGCLLVSEYYADITNAAIEYIRSEHPKVLEQYSEEDIKQFVYANIIQNLNN